MNKYIKSLIVVSAVVALATTAQATPTQGLIISDGAHTTTLFSSSSGFVNGNASFDNWTVVVSTGLSYPPLTGAGSAELPVMDLNVQATSTGGTLAQNLTVTFFGTDFGPTSSGHVNSALTGHTYTGTGDKVTFSVYSDPSNLGAAAHLITASGDITPTIALPPFTGAYGYAGSGGPLDGTLYSLTEVMTIAGGNAASYSLDGSLTSVPDGGTTLVLLGSALSSLALLRKRFAKVA